MECPEGTPRQSRSRFFPDAKESTPLSPSMHTYAIVLKGITVNGNQDDKTSHSHVENGESFRQAPAEAWLPETVLRQGHARPLFTKGVWDRPAPNSSPNGIHFPGPPPPPALPRPPGQAQNSETKLRWFGCIPREIAFIFGKKRPFTIFHCWLGSLEVAF